MTPNELKRNYLFDKLSPDEISELFQRSHDRQVKPGDFLFREGDRGQALYLIEAGSIKMTRKGRKTSEEESVVVGAGVLGEFGYLHRNNRSADAMATLFTLVREIPYAALDEIRKRAPGFAEKLFFAMAALLDDKLRNLPEDIALLKEIKVRYQ